LTKTLTYWSYSQVTKKNSAVNATPDPEIGGLNPTAPQLHEKMTGKESEAVFLVMCDPPMNEL
jgi:hypothetical protein